VADWRNQTARRRLGRGRPDARCAGAAGPCKNGGALQKRRGPHPPRGKRAGRPLRSHWGGGRCAHASLPLDSAAGHLAQRALIGPWSLDDYASGLPHYEVVGTIPCPLADPRRERRDASPPSPSDCRRSAVPLAGGTRGHGSLPVEGGLLDRELAFRLVESGRKGVLFYFFVVQRSMDGDLPGKIRKPIASLYLTASEPEGREKIVLTGCGLVAGWPHDAGRLCSCAVPAGRASAQRQADARRRRRNPHRRHAQKQSATAATTKAKSATPLHRQPSDALRPCRCCHPHAPAHRGQSHL